jgi:phosphatidylserine/phosphatidylglycerophosphate/cardiolipin synthase-like enzyme
MPNTDPKHWFLPAAMMRPGADSDAYTRDNEVVAFIDGEEYMRDLLDALDTCDRGVYLSGWRVTGQQYLAPSAAVTVMDAVRGAITRKARVRAMLYKIATCEWPAPARVLTHAVDNRLFCEAIRMAGQEAILDARLSPKPFSAHHEKFVLVESKNTTRTSAYVGGIDLCLDRWDTPAHASPPQRQRDLIEFYLDNAALLFGANIPSWVPQAMRMRKRISSYTPSMPAWHDVQARVHGPAMQQLWAAFAERWNDPRPANTDAGLEDYRTTTRISSPPRLPPFARGHCCVQVLRTLPCGVFPFAPGGEQTVRRGYERAIRRARHYIYIEDQYLWPSPLVASLAAALRRGVHVVMVVSRDFDMPGLAAVHQRMRARVVDALRKASSRHFHLFHLQQPAGSQIYVHAKTMIVDDAIAFIGSANLNHRSMTNDTELHISVVDNEKLYKAMNGTNLEVCKFAHQYRCRLWAEHLGVLPHDVEDPIATIRTLWAAAPGRRGRAVQHQVQVSPLDVTHLSELVANLVVAGTLPPPIPGLPPLGVPGLPPIPGLTRDALRASIAVAVAAALRSGHSAAPVLTWLEELLNPALVCP